MQIIGIILIVIIIGLYVLWLKFQRKQETAILSSSGLQEIEILIRGAYNPNTIQVQVNKPVKLIFNRQESEECSRFVSIEKLKIRKDLPAFKKTEIIFTPKTKEELNFTCDMGMYQGKIIVN
ncbi:MAG: cupredoxin domain-containing protein [Patescibacteria group bacterium]|jgi:Cu+-exporting ATPase